MLGVDGRSFASPEARCVVSSLRRALPTGRDGSSSCCASCTG
jgi:hypothetical protein